MNTQDTPEIQQITIQDSSLPVIEYKGLRVVTLAMIDKVHQCPSGTAKRNFNENKGRFIENEDYYLIDFAKKYEIIDFGITVPPRGVLVFTESGYMMLVKSLTDDLAWNVQRDLVNRYFKPPLQPAKTLPPPDQADDSHLFRLEFALSRLIAVTKSNGGKLDMPGAYQLIFKRFNVGDYRQLTPEQCQSAIGHIAQLIGQKLISSEAMDDLVAEKIQAKDETNIKRVIWAISRNMLYTNCWSNGCWYAIRNATNTPSPQKFKVQDLPVIAREVERALNITQRLSGFFGEIEAHVLKHVLRGTLDFDACIQTVREKHDKDFADLAADVRSKTREWWGMELKPLRDREDRPGDYSAVDEPKPA